MLKRTILALIMVCFAVMVASECMADGNIRKGKYTYRKVYKACHARGEVDTDLPPVSPSDKTMSQWDRIFSKKKFDLFKCKEEWSKLTDKQLADVHAYLRKHAADSPAPAKCK